MITTARGELGIYAAVFGYGDKAISEYYHEANSKTLFIFTYQTHFKTIRSEEMA